jgi:hypothetical protein
MNAPGTTDLVKNSLDLKKMPAKRENPDDDVNAGAQ